MTLALGAFIDMMVLIIDWLDTLSEAEQKRNLKMVWANWKVESQ